MTIKMSDLPDPDDLGAVLQFAASFDGYGEFGSAKACAEDALAQRRETIRDLRNELFFMYRVANHQGNDGYLEIYRELLPSFRRLLEDGGDATPA